MHSEDVLDILPATLADTSPAIKKLSADIVCQIAAGDRKSLRKKGSLLGGARSSF